MEIIKDIVEVKDDSNLNCSNHTGCTSDTTPEGGGLECGGSVTH